MNRPYFDTVTVASWWFRMLNIGNVQRQQPDMGEDNRKKGRNDSAFDSLPLAVADWGDEAEPAVKTDDCVLGHTTLELWIFLKDEFLIDRGAIPKTDFVNYVNTTMTNLMTGQQRKSYSDLPEERRNLLVKHLENCFEAEATALDEDDVPTLEGEECENDEICLPAKKTKKFLIKAEAGRSGSRAKAIAFVRTYSKKSAWKDKNWYLKINMRNPEPEPEPETKEPIRNSAKFAVDLNTTTRLYYHNIAGLMVSRKQPEPDQLFL
ncbi:hypothetical protein RvY_14753 [Ramazzottius varieornatus]|uniref:Uncharacterized protein n=1 Tax=Ramazzottius varieornatus TaxID=947166 RepID=A0A1D1VW52_RAMVA|nr:hypothetical protein RvY_14753 [Ramazzottius varieornatus]